MRIKIGIASVKSEVEDKEQLPSATVYVTKEGEYYCVDNQIIRLALFQSLKNLETNPSSLVVLEVEVLPMSQRKRRRRRRSGGEV